MSAVSEIMSDKKIVVLDAESGPSVLDAATLMLKNKIGSVIMVNKKQEPVGILTERDILRAVTTGKKSVESSAAEIMSSPVISVKAYDSVETAAAVMAKQKVKRLVVIEQDGSMAGIISLTDITRKLAKILTDEQTRYGKLKQLLEL
jgi:signal-transduction protein with cAMP-binding, CBS, and nucleotidyltransferase domain